MQSEQKLSVTLNTLSDGNTTADGSQGSAFTDRLSAVILISNLQMFVRNIVNLGDTSLPPLV